MDKSAVFCIVLEDREPEGMAIRFIDLYRIGGLDAVTVKTKSCIGKLGFNATGMQKFSEVSDKPVYIEIGVSLGVLMDMYFDCSTGEIKYYELSDSFLTDLVYGRKVMPLPKAQVFAEDRLIVPEIMAELLISENHPGGQL